MPNCRMTMRKPYKYLLSILFCCFIGNGMVIGQAYRKLRLNLQDATFSRLVAEIEKSTDLKVYFDSVAMKDLKVNIVTDNGTLPNILASVLKNTDFVYALDTGRIFITRSYPIQTSLPAGFFVKKSDRRDSLVVPLILSVHSPTENENIKSSPENKLFEFGVSTNKKVSGNAILSGYIRDVTTGEVLSGALLYVDTPSIKAVSDQYGYFSITLPKGRNTLHINSVGMKETKRELMMNEDGKLTIEMENYIANLKAVTVVTDKHSNVMSTQMGIDRVNIRTIKQVPTVLGESDILRVILTLPGVTSVGEASTGFNVRGGAADQNLILLNGATIYNPSHLFGFFSAFNADVIKGVELYKSAIPERYGGRLSSVLDVTTREGNNKKLNGSGGIGLLTSRLAFEGPLNKGKTTFVIGGRTTYSDWLLHQVPNNAYQNSSASFYDLNLNLTHTINPKNTLFLTGYLSHDSFRLNSDTLYTYGNKNLVVKWKHIFNNRFYGTISGGIDQYNYSINSDKYALRAYALQYEINQKHFRTEFTFNPNNQHNVNFGFQAIYYKIHPGTLLPNDVRSLVATDQVPAEQALESAFYIGDRFTITPDFSIDGGIRLSVFNYLGPHNVYQYIPGQPRTATSITDTVSYGSGKNIKSYFGPEIRLAMRYSLSDNASLKFSFNTLRQYIHTLSNNTTISPTDIWKLSDPNIAPQQGYQVSLGYYKNFPNNIETSVEVYYKQIYHYLDYKSGAELIMNKHIETEVINTKGVAYGAEFMIKKTEGKLNGWISYTYSKTKLQIDDPIAGENINNGSFYPASFDKPHNVNLIGNYRFSHRLSISLNTVYSTGRPITLPIAIFNLAGAQRVLYSDRNQYRIPDYFRADISINIEGNHKIKKLAHSSWSLGIYNMLARQNPYSVYFQQESGIIKGYQLSIFGTAIPFVTYNFKF